MAPRKSKADKINKVVPVEDCEHSGAMRTNNPPAGFAHLDRDETPTRALSDDAKFTAARRWIEAVNTWGGLGTWTYEVCWDARKLASTIEHVGA